MLAPRHPRTPERLAAIERYRLGQQAQDGTLDGLVRLASHITGCPVALVSIVHAEAQIFEARIGTDLTQTGLEASVCSHTILGADLLEIEDMRTDLRTADNPLVTDPADPFLFYAGAPITTADGLPLGSFCVLDRKPRRLDAAQREALSILANQVMQRLDLQEALRQQDALRREVDHRVKNSLANVAVLARQAARQAEGAEARDALTTIERRIRVMAELHADLYRADDPDAPIAAGAYLTRIVSFLRDVAPPDVELDATFEPLSLSSGRASALGVLVNELASNAFKHAFPNGRGGHIRFRGEVVEGDRYRLTCVDDGIGAAGTGDGDKPGLGQRIMRATASQLDGALTLEARDDGYRGEMLFPLRPPM
ncbi:histidine kinase dimerization/phosphoacceptor domain -containing protein [Jannaschia ovalis]|uniref:histidine kinase n=1 Tax=Jannaschia ovalis TaxID=3038773 RepID=A0ABY8LFE9_9RHOB|nr:histidine kinase dimerization/phosphoacceptor domain -containing protein [Jannaschia sp. GRR-S6-38]WGH78830.1 histidine kinase dimerization/phosphoacceptor domain -containing protein [Jannaschia sp. GRR-S6-38]